ncbi:pilus assembly protein PilW [Noviherbaspirillum sp. Root189]|nr:pilus assembly protein PilW [Noviherbaspirillum sp. Root189]
MTLIELMISITLGLLVVMAATALLLSAKSGYIAQDDGARMDDTGRYAVELITRAIRQAAYVNWDRQEAPAVVRPGMSPSLEGLDAHRLKATTPGMTSPLGAAVNGSDVLSVQFFGATDDAVVNCAGFPIANQERSASIFYVAEDSIGEPQLYCKYQGDSNWRAEGVARGVEAFQVLYGVDTDEDGLPNKMLNAAAINALDSATAAGEISDEARNAKTFWKKISTVRIAVLVRGTNNSRVPADKTKTVYDLFGDEYSSMHASDDKGTHLSETDFPKSVRQRPRKVYTATVQLRNQASGSGE